jgi:AcrR family transcriptional regulator
VRITEGRRLSTETTVEAALAIADSEGLDAVSLARVARQLDCHVTSLYSHIDSIDDLRLRLVIAVQADLARELWEAALGRAGTAALREIAGVYRRFGEDHPARAKLLFAMTATRDPEFIAGGQVLAEPIRATLAGSGLDERRVRYAHRAFTAALRGFLLAEAQGSYASEADETFDQVVALFVTALDSGSWPE